MDKDVITVGDLTDEQIENWRGLLVELPIPPTYLALGPYALIMPKEEVVLVVRRIVDLLKEEM